MSWTQKQIDDVWAKAEFSSKKTRRTVFAKTSVQLG